MYFRAREKSLFPSIPFLASPVSSNKKKEKKIKMLKQGILFLLWMNCFTIGYLLGSGNRAGRHSTHAENHKWDSSLRALGLLQGRGHPHPGPLCLVQLLFSSFSPSSLPPSRLNNATSSPGEQPPAMPTHARPKVREESEGLEGRQEKGEERKKKGGKGRVGTGCTLCPHRKHIFLTVRCAMLRRERNGQNQHKQPAETGSPSLGMVTAQGESIQTHEKNGSRWKNRRERSTRYWEGDLFTALCWLLSF